MAGINRLGKAPPRPGSLRPPDPNRNKTLDVFSEGTEGDADYMRMVQDIEDTQGGQSGWLFGRGAFDKGDLLYLRDEEEKKRFKEEELRDSERIRFLRMQASVGELKEIANDMPASLPPKPVHPDRPPPRPQSKLLASIVRVKGSKGGTVAARQSPAMDSTRAGQKRPRTEDVPSQAPAQPSAASLNGKGQEPCSNTKQDESDGEPGLAGLLGAYDSDEEDPDVDSAVGAGTKQEKQAAPVLPTQSRRESNEKRADALNAVMAEKLKAPAVTEEEAVDYD